MIQVEGISRRFGAVQALDGVSFTVGRGEVVGFLGPNGAGKTTALRIIAGYLAAGAGRVRVDGIDVAEAPEAAQAKLGYLPENAPLYGDMRVGEYLAFRARLKGVARARLRSQVDEAIDRLALGDARRRPIAELSKGYRQRVGLADALVARPPILLLDEPTAGLDPNQIRDVRHVIRELGRERAVLLSSHILPEIEVVATRVVILVKGRVVAEDRPGALRGAAGAGVVVVVAPADVDKAVAALGETAAVLDAAGGRLRATVAPEDATRRLVEAGCAVREVRAEERTLEQVFTEATR